MEKHPGGILIWRERRGIELQHGLNLAHRVFAGIAVQVGNGEHRPSSAFAPKGHRRVTDIVSFGSTNAGNADRLVDRLPAQGQCFRPWRCFIGGNTCGLACKMTGREEWLERCSMAAT